MIYFEELAKDASFTWKTRSSFRIKIIFIISINFLLKFVLYGLWNAKRKIFNALKIKYKIKVKQRIGQFKPSDLDDEACRKAQTILDGLDIEEAENGSAGIAIFFAWCIVSLAAKLS